MSDKDNSGCGTWATTAKYAEFDAPAVFFGRAEPHQDCSWRLVSRRRKEWLRSLQRDQLVLVVDDHGNVWKTRVKALRPAVRSRSKRDLEPQLWLHGHGSSYSPSRVWDVRRTFAALAGGLPGVRLANTATTPMRTQSVTAAVI